MRERSRPKAQESVKVPSAAPLGRPEHTSMAKAKPDEPSSHPNEQSLGADEIENQSLAVDGVYIISVAARILEMHPQTLRKYERLGLINPGRTLGMFRLYSSEDIRRVRLIQRLSNMGLNLAGIEFALSTAENLLVLKCRLQALAKDGHTKNAIESEVGAVLQILNLSVGD